MKGNDAVLWMEAPDPNKQFYETDGVPEDEGSYTKLRKAEEVILSSLQNEIKDKPILDLGVGAGRTTPYLREISTNYIGADYSTKMIDLARKRHPEATFVHCDARCMPMFADECFTAVFFFGAGIGSVMPPSRGLIFKEVIRVLTRNGVFAFSTYNIDYQHVWPFIGFDFTLNAISFIKDSSRRIFSYAHRRIIRSTRKVLKISDAIALEYDEITRTLLPSYYVSLDCQVSELLDTGFSKVTALDMTGIPIKKDERAEILGCITSRENHE